MDLKSTILCAALIVGLSILGATGITVYYSPYQICVRNKLNNVAAGTVTGEIMIAAHSQCFGH